MAADLKTKFWDDVEWFNNGLFDADAGYDRFDENVEMKKIDDVGWTSKKGDVKVYFKGHGKDDQARFDPDDLPGSQYQPTFKEIDDSGFVSGIADFIYSTKKPDLKKRRRIAYSFAYTRDPGATPPNDEWKLIYLWGQYID